ncbi:variable surface protein [Plasmodium gonderi]|uniref:Variable surface protein n=1 Tax=Plasmodium gonderi TaxID=77519 RepID=A0A1Y1JNX8_PLAGO|nr:variable surface protein [Plasmodium gonderi]GAW84181.1 variable surface protein [Plasmodium gonderi]
MNGTISERDDFNFNGMFHTCIYSFNWNIDEHRSESDQKFTFLCSNYFNDVIKGVGSPTIFSKWCRVLCMYLEHIESSKRNNAQECCKLFYYKLEKDIIDKFAKEKNINAKECYQKMIDYKRENINTTISEICKNYSEHIDQDTFTVLGYLFEIYEYIDIFKEMKRSDTQKMNAFQEKIFNLANYPYNNKSLLKEELEKIIDICKGYKIRWTVHPYNYAADRITDSWINKIRGKFDEEVEKRSIEHEKNIPGINVIEPHALMNTGTDVVSNTGIGIGMVFISFSILIIMIILYKYTPYFSFLQPRLRKLRITFNKNKKYIPDFMYSFDVKYKNSVEHSHKIAYN